MAYVQITPNLQRFFPALEREAQVHAGTVAELIRLLDREHRGLADYLMDEAGSLRKHVQIFVNDAQVVDRKGLSDPLGPDARVFIVQALSGG
jgi:molybdopterin synthase sulfur carrier subunit